MEATLRNVEVRQSHTCTNHFELLREENRHHLADSQERLQVMQEQENVITDAYQAFRLLNDTEKGIFSQQYKNWSGTIHTAACLPKRQKAWFAVVWNRDPVVFDFADWLKGNDFNAKRVLGKVNTDLPFVHTQKHVH